MSYVWQHIANGGASWRDSGLSGYDTATITVPIIAARNGTMWRCIVTGAAVDSITSNTANLNVAAA